MPLISANNMIRGISLFHLTLAVTLLRNPALIAKQGIVLVLEQSMQLPTPREFSKPSPAIAFLAVLFAFLGISDLTSLSLHEQISDEYWGLQAPVRLFFLFAVTGYSYAFKEGGLLGAKGADYRASVGAGLNNSILFTWGFLEIGIWFWVYTALREERVAKAKIVAEKQARENKQL